MNGESPGIQVQYKRPRIRT